MRKLLLGVIVGGVICTGFPLYAQQGTAQLGGTVADAGGGVLPGVNIVLTNEDSGVFREAISTADGSYFVSQMVPGRYRIIATLSGFKTLDRRGVVLTVGETTTVNLTLEVGGVTETLTVTGEAPLIDVTSSQIGGHISATELAELPAQVRSYMAFAGTIPGARFVPAAGFLNDTMQANGQPSEANNIAMDGATNIDDLRGSNVGGQARVSNEALQEVQIITNQFDAEYGRASGAVVNAVTKSGSNQFTGAAFGFFTAKSVTSRNFFTRVTNQPEPNIGKQEWGGTIGGPILRNKLFFFFTLERAALKRPQGRTFQERPEFNFSNQTDESAWNTLWRIDQQVNSNNTWAFRWLREFAPQYNVLGGANNAVGAQGDETDLDQTLVATWTTVLGNTKVNTVRLGATLEDTVHSNANIRALKPEYARCVPCPDEMLLENLNNPPRLQYREVNLNSTTMDFSLDDAYSIEDTFSWFIPTRFGRHDTKFGAKYTYIWISNPNTGNMNGTYTFRHNSLPFNAADPRTYPERFSIRVPSPTGYELFSRVYEGYAQDKWQIASHFTLSLGIRYDLEVTPVQQLNNPLFSDPSKYPVDKNNWAPRIGMVWNPDRAGKAIVRAGYGKFYDRTILGTLDDLFFNTKYSSSFIANFPAAQADTSAIRGEFPQDPLLRSTSSVTQLSPEVRGIINSSFPAGSTIRNTGQVDWDDPERTQPYFHQASVGYEREVFQGVSLAADYIHMAGRSLFLNPNLNIFQRVSTTRGARLLPLDAFGVLTPSLAPGETPYSTTVRLRTNKFGYTDYDGLNFSLEKRYSNNWSLRASYALGYSRGVTGSQTDTPQFQVGSDLRLKEYEGPANVDRRHVVTISGRTEIPRTGGLTVSGNIRMMSGTPFTINDSDFDLDQNGISFDPLPGGTYNPFEQAGEYVMRDVENDGGRNGAIGPGFMQLDLRFGYRLRMGGRRTFDVFGELFNATDRANFTNPNGDRSNRNNFLRLTGLIAGTGLPRQAQLGLRFGF